MRFWHHSIDKVALITITVTLNRVDLLDEVPLNKSSNSKISSAALRRGHLLRYVRYQGAMLFPEMP